jgi:hypothetical protein
VEPCKFARSLLGRFVKIAAETQPFSQEFLSNRATGNVEYSLYKNMNSMKKGTWATRAMYWGSRALPGFVHVWLRECGETVDDVRVGGLDILNLLFPDFQLILKQLYRPDRKGTSQT